MTEQPVGPHCGNNPNARLTDGDRKAVNDFKARLALQAAAQPYADSAAWVDGDPLMEVIAATIWKHCARDDQNQPQAVSDDPRTIAAYAAAVARAQAEMVQATPTDRTTAALAEVRRLCHMTIADSIRADAIDQARDTLAAIDRIMSAEQPPLSPYYQHPACGFHWHGRDGMDIPMRDGQPICPRCEIAGLQAPVDGPVSFPPPDQTADRAAVLLEAADGLERTNPDRSADFSEGVDWALAELRRLAAEAQQPNTESPEGLRCVCGDPVQLMDDNDPTSWIHSPGSDTRCLEARPRCPHCGLPHGLDPGSRVPAVCASFRASLADADRRHAQGDHGSCARVNCEVLRERTAPDEERPVHKGGNAEDCPACIELGFDMLSYPWECPGPEATSRPDVPVHACPGPDDNGISPCCGRPPFEFRGERLTRDPAQVTCKGVRP